MDSSSYDSPSKNTRHATNRRHPPSAPVRTSPVRHRTAKKPTDDPTSKKDLQVWDLSDAEIIASHRRRWKSPVYDHYTITLQRNYSTDDNNPIPLSMSFIFTCRHDPALHPPHLRARSDASTGNLARGLKSCDGRRGLIKEEDGDSERPRGPAYSQQRHRTLIALRCATSHRPFNMVCDPHYILEVELLRPGTRIPSPSTVSRDTRKLWEAAASHAKSYFANYDGVIHLALDGWTSPIIFSYLGIVVIWYDKGKVWRAVLDMSRLKSNHTGPNMADNVYRVLTDFNILWKFFSGCLDNASNCDTLIKHMHILHDPFPGMARRGRCWPHVINLVEKAFIGPFIITVSKRKAIKPKPKAVGKRKRALPSPDIDPDLEAEAEKLAEVNATEAEAELEELFPTSEEETLDPGRLGHDKEVVLTAISSAEETLPPIDETFTEDLEEERIFAKGILSKAAGLAKRVHDCAHLAEQFDRIVQNDVNEGNLKTDKTALDRRVTTRWNSDLTCISAHVLFESQIKQLIAKVKGLDEYLMTAPQWDLAKEMEEVLQIFEGPTLLFSRADVPLIFEVIPMMDEMIIQLKNVIAQVHGKLHAITILAAKAALNVALKYQSLNDECELYDMSIALCPDKKIAYFSRRSNESKMDLQARLIMRFRDFVAGGQFSGDTPHGTQEASETAVHSRTGSPDSISPSAVPPKRSKWATATNTQSYTNGSTCLDPDTPEGWLAEPPIPEYVVRAAGGPLAWWETQRQTRPRLYRMAIAYLTSPASSVDAERAFSQGRLNVNHLQHNMTSNTFRAKMALGSWAGTPLMPPVEELATSLL